MKHHLRSALALLLALVLLCSVLPASLAQETKQSGGRAMGRIHVTHAGSNSVTNAWLNARRSGAQVSSSLPAKYDSREYGYVTAVRNQNPYGSCWAHGAIASVESYMIKHGITDSSTGNPAAKSMNLSEYHLAWYNYTYAYDALHMLQGDRSAAALKTDGEFLDQGGFGEMATYTLMRWEGPASESNPPALAYSNASPNGLGANYAYQYNVAHVTDVDWIPTANIDAVKQAIMEFGAGTFGYCHEDAYSNDSTGAYCYIQSASPDSDYFDYSNHDVTVVGWDDNYARTNFNSVSRPKSNGAWIIKNSWGADFGDGGYMYISYEDSASLNDYCYFYRVAAADNYDNLYQYDGTNNYSSYIELGSSGTIATEFVANGSESLEAVALCTWDEGVNYTVKIYTGCTTSNPASGTLAASQSGSIPYQGYHSIRLGSPVTLTAGQRYAVVFELSASELNMPYDASGAVEDYVTWTHTTHTSTSFYKSGSSWKATPDNGNFRIKAYTKNAGSHVHDYQAAVTAPTCTERGYTTYTCAGCGDSYVDNYVDALGHNFEEFDRDEPTCTLPGVIYVECARCSATDNISIPALGHNFVEGFCTRCGEKDPNLNPGGDNPETPTFVDVPNGAYYAEPVRWAVENGITTGTGQGRFSPEAKCTRGQVVTFLWRAKGSPEPGGSGGVPVTGSDMEPDYDNPFSDVKESDYFFKAVLWAVENDVTQGTGGGKFSPGKSCTRGQVVTFLWRTEGKPEPQATRSACRDGILPSADNLQAARAASPFSDVKPTDYYFTAVLWAVENDITQGTGGGRFSPGKSCTRAQIVTFLYRALA